MEQRHEEHSYAGEASLDKEKSIGKLDPLDPGDADLDEKQDQSDP
jgi:hypothetical protein